MSLLFSLNIVHLFLQYLNHVITLILYDFDYENTYNFFNDFIEEYIPINKASINNEPKNIYKIQHISKYLSCRYCISSIKRIKNRKCKSTCKSYHICNSFFAFRSFFSINPFSLFSLKI